jgi:hypothetical protein
LRPPTAVVGAAPLTERVRATGNSRFLTVSCVTTAAID